MQTRYLIVEVIISCKSLNILNPTPDVRLMISSGTLWLLWTTEAPCGPREQLWEMEGPRDCPYWWRSWLDFNILSESNFDKDILSEIHHAGTSGQVDSAQAIPRKMPKQYKNFSNRTPLAKFILWFGANSSRFIKKKKPKKLPSSTTSQ